MEKQHDGVEHDRVTPSMIDRLKDLTWDHQTPEMIRQVLELAKRTMKAPIQSAEAPTEAMISQRMRENRQLWQMGQQRSDVRARQEAARQEAASIITQRARPQGPVAPRQPRQPVNTTAAQPRRSSTARQVAPSGSQQQQAPSGPQQQQAPSGSQVPALSATHAGADQRHTQAQALLQVPTQDMINAVQIQWARSMLPDDVVVTLEGIIVRHQDFARVKPGVWLSDELMNFHNELVLKRDIARRSGDESHKGYHVFNTFFMDKLLDVGRHGRHSRTRSYNYQAVRKWGLRRWGTQWIPGGIFAQSKVFVPINIGNYHWILAVIDIDARTIKCYDSSYSAGATGIDKSMYYLEHLKRYLHDEWVDKKLDGPVPEWRLIDGSTEPTPQQGNGCDCGVFVLHIIELLTQDLPVAFTQRQISSSLHRHRIGYRILNKSLDP
jgi:sentrin-specific protease 1